MQENDGRFSIPGMIRYAWMYVSNDARLFAKREGFAPGCGCALAIAIMPVIVPIVIFMTIRHRFTRIGRIHRAPSASQRYPALIVEPGMISEHYGAPPMRVLRDWLAEHDDLRNAAKMSDHRVLRYWEKRAKNNVISRHPREVIYAMEAVSKYTPARTPFEPPTPNDGCFVLMTNRTTRTMSYLLPNRFLSADVSYQECSAHFQMGYTELWVIRHVATHPASVGSIMKWDIPSDPRDVFAGNGEFLVLHDAQFSSYTGGLIARHDSLEEANKHARHFAEAHRVATCVGQLATSHDWH